MKRTIIRTGVFETNSSSVHAFVVFDDPTAQEAWTNSNQEIYLDGRYLNWKSCHEVEWADAFNEDWINEVSSQDLVRIGTPEWDEIVKDIREVEDIWHDYDEYPDKTVAEIFRVVPFGTFYDGFHSSRGAGWGNRYENVVECSSDGREIFTIVCNE